MARISLPAHVPMNCLVAEPHGMSVTAAAAAALPLRTMLKPG
jgi:hypothetical protein